MNMNDLRLTCPGVCALWPGHRQSNLHRHRRHNTDEMRFHSDWKSFVIIIPEPAAAAAAGLDIIAIEVRATNRSSTTRSQFLWVCSEATVQFK